MAATAKEARQLGARIQSAAQARDLFAAASQSIDKALASVDDFDVGAFLILAPVEFGQKRALLSRIRSVQRYGDRIEITDSDWQADRVALFYLQAEDVLKEVAASVRDSQARNSIEGILRGMQESARNILKGAARVGGEVVAEGVRTLPPSFIVVGLIAIGVFVWAKLR